jgi:hypothetical protein
VEKTISIGLLADDAGVEAMQTANMTTIEINVILQYFAFISFSFRLLLEFLSVEV